MVKILLSCVGKYRRPVVLTPLFIAGEVLMEILIPFIMAGIIDKGILGGGGIGYTLKMGVLLTVITVVSLVFGALAGKFAARGSAGFAKNLRNLLFAKIQEFSFANVDKYSTASLVTRLTTDVTNTQNAFMIIIRIAVRAPLMLVGAFFMAFTLNRSLSTIFLVAVPLLGVSLYGIAAGAHPRFKEMLRRYDRMNAAVQENLIGVRTVKAYVREDYEREKFNGSADAVREAQLSAEKLVILNMPIMQLCMYLCIVAVLWFGGRLVIGHSMEIGQLAGFITYVVQILISLMVISFVLIVSVISRASVVRILEILQESPDIRDDTADQSLSPEDGSILFRNVSFAYDKSGEGIALEGVDLAIRSGETIGIIGGTGSGKSTLVQLIPRFYDVCCGEIVVAGHNVKEYRLSTLRGSVAMVLQKSVLFSGTILENLLWGNPAATEGEVVEACKTAQAHEFISSFSEGYRTRLGQGGVNLSGGQKQRLSIARALLKKPKILILDDSTSAVDTATDSRLRSGLKEERFGVMTKLIVSQRISSIADADRIVVLENGKVNGFDTHQGLLKSNAIYREVYESQRKGAN